MFSLSLFLFLFCSPVSGLIVFLQHSKCSVYHNWKFESAPFRLGIGDSSLRCFLWRSLSHSDCCFHHGMLQKVREGGNDIFVTCFWLLLFFFFFFFFQGYVVMDQDRFSLSGAQVTIVTVLAVLTVAATASLGM